jgi:ApbE superfamily uncharacterized protein (UPF0280 family)
MSAIAALLPDGRLHLQHGPIDCLCQAWGSPAEIRAAYRQAADFFQTVLSNLCAELPLLRQPLPAPRPQGAIARSMHAACTPFATKFITPMAAVAGAVADAVLAAMCHGRTLSKAFVNNGGDIAFHLAPGTSLRCGLVTDLAASVLSSPTSVPSSPVSTPPWPVSAPTPSWPGLSGGASTRATGAGTRATGAGTRATGAGTQTRPPLPAPASNRREIAGTVTPPLDGIFLLTAVHPARGLATSGRACKGQGGRSFSFGIADSVSVLARTAAQADAAATIIGNAVDLPAHPAIDRRPASAIDPDSDLGDRLITFDVGSLSDETIVAALDAGAIMADNLLQAGLIEGAVLSLRGRVRISHSPLASQEVA